METIELIPPKLPNVRMNCDEIIDEKLTKYPAVECCFAKTSYTVIAGLMGQGKTSLAINLLRGPFKKCFSHIYVIIPEVSLQSIDAKDNIFIKHIDEDHMYHEYNADVLEEIYNKTLQHKRDGEFSILLIDDFGAEFRTDKNAEVIMNRMIIKMRHTFCSVMLLAQNIYQLPKKWREMATNLITYDLGKSQMTKIFEEFYNYKPQQIYDIMELYKNPHDWLMLNVKNKRLFFKFELEIKFKKQDKDAGRERTKSI
jgi:DNA replication protein DnaC